MIKLLLAVLLVVVPAQFGWDKNNFGGFPIHRRDKACTEFNFFAPNVSVEGVRNFEIKRDQIVVLSHRRSCASGPFEFDVVGTFPAGRKIVSSKIFFSQNEPSPIAFKIWPQNVNFNFNFMRQQVTKVFERNENFTPIKNIERFRYGNVDILGFTDVNERAELLIIGSFEKIQIVFGNVRASLGFSKSRPNQIDPNSAQTNAEQGCESHYGCPKSGRSLSIQIILCAFVFFSGLFCLIRALSLGEIIETGATGSYFILGPPLMLCGLVGGLLVIS